MQTEPERPGEACSALATLGLNSEELVALAKQGFVCAEVRGDGGLYHKLRFRLGDRQQVRYLGKDLEFVKRVKADLAQLQQRIRLQRKLGRLVRAAKHKLRTAKIQIEPLLKGAGFAFHGMAVRQPRSGGRQQTILTESQCKEENHEE
jgi:hypothetical protein